MLSLCFALTLFIKVTLAFCASGDVFRTTRMPPQSPQAICIRARAHFFGFVLPSLDFVKMQIRLIGVTNCHWHFPVVRCVRCCPRGERGGQKWNYNAESRAGETLIFLGSALCTSQAEFQHHFVPMRAHLGTSGKLRPGWTAACAMMCKTAGKGASRSVCPRPNPGQVDPT